jgi:hypothetical protein
MSMLWPICFFVKHFLSMKTRVKTKRRGDIIFIKKIYRIIKLQLDITNVRYVFKFCREIIRNVAS